MFLVIIAFPISILVWATAIHFFYTRIFHRKKDVYEELFYFAAACSVLGIALGTIMSVIPGIIGQILQWITVAYPILLMMIGVAAITKLKWWESLIAVTIGYGLSYSIILCSPYLIYSLSGAVQRVY